MSERKSAEIKFRCTPSFKASLAASAEAGGVSMSEYIETAVWSQQNAQLGSKSLLLNAIESMREKGDEPGLLEYISTNTNVCVPLTKETLDRALEMVAPEPDSAADEDEFDSDDIVAVAATSIDEDNSAAIHIATGAADPKGLGVLRGVEFVPTNVACTCRPWEFCTHKATG